ncbi:MULTISPECIES: 4-hydroxy-tetrahydrodipicolinate reductase [Staphylococcus]|uniref:4-hydroxy-tetrahydrodipicolinate reductase n=1 Tax=Staphylococcus TaxID=1279 RepID=UPI000D03CE7A|nr:MULTISPECIES: 4-hydroxy-tetrahydrodipicolinate reductase [Staphylococcus]MCD8915160.1 4-hydroxy-tetrahydrodipicolinate reductase [Staphylococcus simulans]UXV33961.1 4-hydroxy-tetrahydrodipicolinate reductase [Staphylococcus sp. IVB6181]
MKILLIGYGAMNQRVARLAEEQGHEITGIIVPDPDSNYPYPAFNQISEAKDAEVAIDFSNPELLLPLLDQDFKLPVVVATTGEKEKIIAKLKELSENMPVFFSANMSYGIHVMTKLLELAVPLLQGYDIELIEAHHNKKVDAPSGTLIKLLDVIKEVKDEVNPVYDRSQTTERRKPEDIGISAVRGGTIVGEHEVLFAGVDETIELTHRAQSKDIFANGAIKAAERLVTKSNGYYTFDNLNN